MINLPELEIQTQDGWKLKAYHHECTNSMHLPVLVFHAMALSAYSLNGNGGIPSIASWLSHNGYDVWVCECRDVGKSIHQDKKKRLEWSFDDHLKYDVSQNGFSGRIAGTGLNLTVAHRCDVTITTFNINGKALSNVQQTMEPA